MLSLKCVRPVGLISQPCHRCSSAPAQTRCTTTQLLIALYCTSLAKVKVTDNTRSWAANAIGQFFSLHTCDRKGVCRIRSKSLLIDLLRHLKQPTCSFRGTAPQVTWAFPLMENKKRLDRSIRHFRSLIIAGGSDSLTWTS